MKTRTITISVNIKGEDYPSDNDMLEIATAATSNLNSAAKEKGFAVDDLVVNCPSNIDRELTPSKYSGSRYKKERITKVIMKPNGQAVIVTRIHNKTFDVGIHYVDTSADYILCAIQDEEGINVSKY